MAEATLTINSRNYGSWSLRGWLLCKMAGLDFDDRDGRRATIRPSRAELLLLSPSFLVPCLTHDGDQGVGHAGDRRIPQRAQARGRPAAGRRATARARAARSAARCIRASRNLRSALPMNLQGALSGLQGVGRRAGRHRPHHRRSGASAWRSTAGLTCSASSPTWRTPCTRRCARASSPTTSSSTRLRRLLRGHHGAAAMQEWIEPAKTEPEEVEELDVEF